jgi:hypothetical protein
MVSAGRRAVAALGIGTYFLSDRIGRSTSRQLTQAMHHEPPPSKTVSIPTPSIAGHAAS